MKITLLNIARILLIISVLSGLTSWLQTMSHVGDENYLVMNYPEGKYHAWFHAFRESIMDLGMMIVFVVIFFGASQWRTISIWKITLVLMIVYYLPFWTGGFFLSQLKPPSLMSEIVHSGMTIPALTALFISKKDFYKS